MNEASKQIIVGVTEAENKIKEILKDALINGTPKDEVKKQGMKAINDFVKEIEVVDKNLSLRIKRMLVEFLVRTHKSILIQLAKDAINNAQIAVLANQMGAFTLEEVKAPKNKPKFDNGLLIGGSEEQQAKVRNNIREFYTTGETGASQMLISDYRKKVNSIIKTLPDRKAYELEQLKQNKKFRKRSARSIAENIVRYDERVQDMNKLQTNGVKYVVASSHRNASERCSYWQGKIFILDTTETFQTGNYSKHRKPNPHIIGHVDGRPYYSLKEALDYGFLGYNCRHRLIKYTPGMPMPKQFNYKDIAKWRAINDRQRYLERQIVLYKTRALFSTDKEESKRYRAYSRQLTKEYEAFCRGNNLVIERWRTCISKEERDFFVDDLGGGV